MRATFINSCLHIVDTRNMIRHLFTLDKKNKLFLPFHIVHTKCTHIITYHIYCWHFCRLQSSIGFNICTTGHLLYTRFKNELMALTSNRRWWRWRWRWQWHRKKWNNHTTPIIYNHNIECWTLNWNL